MLKIKDNVDLKELEKFNFEYREDDDEEDGKWHYWCPKDNSNLSIDVINELNSKLIRVIDDGGFGFSKEDLNIIYDLIKADLVEKVDE